MTIYPRGNVYYVEDLVAGKRVKRSTGVKVKEGRKRAEREALRILREVAIEDDAPLTAITLKEASEKTYNVKWRHNKDEKTPVERSRILQEILGEDIPLASITLDTIQELKQELFARDLKPATVNRYLSALSCIFNTVGLKGPKMERYQEPRGRVRYLTDTEERTLLDYLNSSNLGLYADFFACLLDTGMRFSEMNNLLARDINQRDLQIHVWDNKGDMPRTIPMTPRVEQTLLGRIHRLGSGKVWNLSYDHTHEIFGRAKKHLGLEHDRQFCIHALRHTFASRLVQAGVSLYVVQRLLGHSSIQVTEKYAHLNTESLEDAMEVLSTRGTLGDSKEALGAR